MTWRKLPQLVEVVSVEDECLLGILTAEELLNIAEVGMHLVCFRDLKRLQENVARVGVTAPINLLCVFRAKGGACRPATSLYLPGLRFDRRQNCRERRDELRQSILSGDW